MNQTTTIAGTTNPWDFLTKDNLLALDVFPQTFEIDITIMFAKQPPRMILGSFKAGHLELDIVLDLWSVNRKLRNILIRAKEGLDQDFLLASVHEVLGEAGSGARTTELQSNN